MLEYFNCYTSKKEFYNYENLKKELRENGLSDKKGINKDYKKDKVYNHGKDKKVL